MAKVIDDSGFWSIKDNPISKEGVFPYLGRNISPELEPDKIYMVYRPIEELSADETLTSFNGVPFIDNHEMIGEGFTPYDERPAGGVLMNPRTENGVMYGDFKIYSEDLKEKILNGKKELSLGYLCDYEVKRGVWNGKPYDAIQKHLRGNHIALVDNARMGKDCRVYDSKTFATDSFSFDSDDKEIQWITVKGNHIPVKEGETKKEAVENFLENKSSKKGSSENKKYVIFKIKGSEFDMPVIVKTGSPDYESAKKEGMEEIGSANTIAEAEKEFKKRKESFLEKYAEKKESEKSEKIKTKILSKKDEKGNEYFELRDSDGKLISKSDNYLGATEQAGKLIAFYQRGVLQGDISDMGVYCNEMWLKDAISTDLLNMFLALKQIPTNNSGKATVRSVMVPVCESAKLNGVIQVGKELDSVQKAYITSLTGDNEVWREVEQSGYTLDIDIVQTVNANNGLTEYKVDYTLIYSKGDSIKSVTGTNILV